MSAPRPVRSSPPFSTAAFSLSEVILALAIIATCFGAVLGLLPAGLQASRDAADSTVVALVFENVHNRLRNEPLKTGPVSFSPAFFDEHGVFISPDAKPEELRRRVYRADVRLGEWHERPAHTSVLTPVVVQLSWPVDPTSGEPIGKQQPKAALTYGVTALTGSDWPLIYPKLKPAWKYEPKIEF